MTRKRTPFALKLQQTIRCCFPMTTLRLPNSTAKERSKRSGWSSQCTEVLVRGHSLRRIETAMQRMELSFLSALSANQRSLIPDGQPVVAEIVVTQVDPQGSGAFARSG